MNLYLISQDKNWEPYYYESAVVAAESEQQAKATHPNGDDVFMDGYWIDRDGIRDIDKEAKKKSTERSRADNTNACSTWAPISDVKVELIGVAITGTKTGVINNSFIIE